MLNSPARLAAPTHRPHLLYQRPPPRPQHSPHPPSLPPHRHARSMGTCVVPVQPRPVSAPRLRLRVEQPPCWHGPRQHPSVCAYYGEGWRGGVRGGGGGSSGGGRGTPQLAGRVRGGARAACAHRAACAAAPRPLPLRSQHDDAVNPVANQVVRSVTDAFQVQPAPLLCEGLHREAVQGRRQQRGAAAPPPLPPSPTTTHPSLLSCCPPAEP